MSPPNPHPSFASPTIQEALCELHFTRAEGQKWNAQWFGDLFKKAGDDYPHMEPNETGEVGFGVTPDGTFVPQMRRTGIRTLYRHRARPQLFQLSDSTFTVNELAPYEGWEVFQRDIQRGWDLLAQTVAPKGLDRIGLRYINRIPRGGPDEPVSEWIASSEYVPERVRSATSRFHSRLQLPVSENVRLIVTVAELEEEDRVWIMLDIDTVLFAQVPPEWAKIAARASELHDLVWEVFQGCMTDKLRAHLEEASHADQR